MTTEKIIRVLAGSMILISVALAYFVSQRWLLMTCFVGGNLIQSALTEFCPAGIVLKKMGIGSGSCCSGSCQKI